MGIIKNLEKDPLNHLCKRISGDGDFSFDSFVVRVGDAEMGYLDGCFACLVRL